MWRYFGCAGNEKGKNACLLMAILTVLAVIVTVPLSGGIAQAWTIQLSPEELESYSDVIVIGSVSSQEAYWNAGHTSIYTLVTISLERSLKGSPPDLITVIVHGGSVGNNALWIEDMPRFYEGERIALYLRQLSDAELADMQPAGNSLPRPAYAVTGHEQGKIHLESGAAGDAVISGLKSGLGLEADVFSTPTGSNNVVTDALPYISSVTPNTASSGTNSQVVIGGGNFGSTQGTSKVYFRRNNYGDVSATIISWSNTSITVTVPGSVDSSYVYVQTAAGDSNKIGFTVTFNYNGHKWSGSNPVVKYKVNPNTSDCTGEETAVQAAAATWNAAVSPKFQLQYDGTTSETSPDWTNAEKRIWWKDFGEYSITPAEAYISYNSDTGAITGATIQFNTRFHWSNADTTPSGYYDIESITLHEFGHWLELCDMYGTADTAKVMYGERAKGPSGMRRALTTDDRNGIQWIYGTSAPTAPVLSSPASGSTSSTLTPTLDWQDTAGAASYGVQISTSSNFTSTVVNQDGLTASTYTVPGSTLAWNTTYYWRVNAVNTKGSSAWSAVRNFKTATGPPPSAPSSLTATPVSSTRIDLGWTDNSDGETGFKIERRKGTGTYAQIASVGPNTTAYSNISGLTANTGYTYRVRAYSGTLNSDYSNEADATTLPLPPAVPTPVSPASGATVATLTPTLDWNDPAGATRYGLQVSTVSNFATTIVDETSLSTSTYTFSGGLLSWNTYYYWRVYAANSYGSASRWSSARRFKTAIGPPPNAPSSLTATPISSTRIDLGWTDNSGNEAGFKIERRKGTGAYALIATVGPDTTTYSNTSGLTANTGYTYRVRAYLSTLYSSYSNEADATTLPPPPAVPTPVSPASGATVATLTPTLDWNDPAGATRYGLQVSTVSNFATTIFDETSLSTSTYTFSGGLLSWNTYYYWRVYAANSYGSASRWSGARRFKTAIGPPPNAPSSLTATPISSTRIDLGWTDNSGNEAGFKIERRKGTGAYALIATVGPDTTTYSNTSGLTANTGYTYRVRAYLSTLYSSYSNEADATTLPLPPAVPTLTSPGSGTTVTVTPTLDWNEPAGATRYGLQVSTSSTFATTLLDQNSLLVSNYTVPDGTLNHNTLYYWRANAANAAGSTSRWSAARSFRTAP